MMGDLSGTPRNAAKPPNAGWSFRLPHGSFEGSDPHDRAPVDAIDVGQAVPAPPALRGFLP